MVLCLFGKREKAILEEKKGKNASQWQSLHAGLLSSCDACSAHMEISQEAMVMPNKTPSLSVRRTPGALAFEGIVCTPWQLHFALEKLPPRS